MTLDDIKDRCVEEGECWLWKGALSGGKWPCIWHEGKTVPVRRVVWTLHKGKTIPANVCITPKCDNDLCVCPGCLVGRVGRRAARPATMQRRIRMATSLRAKSRISDEAVMDIRTSGEPLAVLAERHGISYSYADQLRRGVRRRDFSSPFAGLGALLRTP